MNLALVVTYVCSLGRRKVPLSLISRSFGKSTVSQHVPKNVAGKLQELRTSSTSNGQVYLGHGVAPVTGSAQIEIVDALCLGERRRASSLLSELGHGKCSLRSDDFLYILKYCARAPDPLFVMETWRFMEEKQIDINGKCYLFIIRALCKGGYLKEAFSFINTLRENPDTYPILPMCNNFLGACAQMHSIDFANECLDLMERQMVGKNEVSYAELLKLAVMQQNLSAVHEIWKECIRVYSHSIISLRKFIWSFTRLRDLESAYTTLQHMVVLAFRGDSVVTKTAEGKLSTSRLDIPIPSKHLCFKSANKDNTLFLSEHFNKFDSYGSNSEHSATYGMVEREIRSGKTSMLRKQLSVPVMKVLRWSFSDVIHACGHARNYILAEKLILQMQSIGMEPSCSTYDGFIRAVSSKGFHDALKVLKVMQQKNMKPYDSTLATISISCSRGLELDMAEAFLDQMSESSYIYPYNAFLEACNSLDQPERAVQVLAKMKQLKLQPDIRTYELLFSLFGNVNAPYEEGNMLSQVDAAKRINAIEMDMINNGIQHSHLSMKNLLKALGAEGMIRELIQYLHRAENQFTHNGAFLETAVYNIVLHSLVEAKESQMAIEIFKTMKAYGFLPDAATYNIMIDCCSIIRCFKSACALVSLMIRDGYCLQVTTYTALMKIFLGDKDFDGALNLMDQGISEGIQPDILLYNTVLQEACEEGRIDVIELIVREMRQTNIQPDPSTCSYVFSAYVDQGFFSTAVEALQVLSMQMISEPESRLQEMRSELESLVFAEDSEAESQILKLFNKSEVNLAAALLNLRWCATLGFPISWFPSQSAWANRLSSSH